MDLSLLEKEGNALTKGRTGVKTSSLVRHCSYFTAQTVPPTNPQTEGSGPGATRPQDKVKAYYSYWSKTQHYLNQCHNFSELTKEQKSNCVKTNKKCWCCGRTYQAAQCRLKTTCEICKGRHLEALHELNDRPIRENPACQPQKVFKINQAFSADQLGLA